METDRQTDRAVSELPTSQGGQDLGPGGDQQEQQMSGEGDGLTEHAAAQLQQHGHAPQNRAPGLVAGTARLDLHLTDPVAALL